MAKGIPVVEVDEDIITATNSLAESCFEEDIFMLNVKPAQHSPGMDKGPEFLDSIHYLDMKRRILRSDINKSPACSFEMWYENNETKFMFTTPSKHVEQEYRQQINGHYGGDIAQQTPNEGMFVRAGTSPNPEAVAVTRYQLPLHYYYGIASPVSDEEELEGDPFQRILNEVDTKDDTRVLFQIMYKPAPYDWVDSNYMPIEKFADAIQDQGNVKKRWWGLKVEEVDDPGIYDSAAANMRGRVGKSAYFVNIRMCVICSGDTAEDAKKQASLRLKSISNEIKHIFETRAGQRLVPYKTRFGKSQDARTILTRMIEREPAYMERPGTFGEIMERPKNRFNIIVLTSGELAGFIHLPGEEDLDTGTIKWTETVVQGSVPPDAESVSEEDIKDIEGLEEGIEEEMIGKLSDEDEEEEEEDEDDEYEGSTSTLFD